MQICTDLNAQSLNNLNLYFIPYTADNITNMYSYVTKMASSTKKKKKKREVSARFGRAQTFVKLPRDIERGFMFKGVLKVEGTLEQPLEDWACSTDKPRRLSGYKENRR